MPLHLEVTSNHKELMGDDAVRQFRESGGTIGRGLQSDWILPDAERFISSRHAVIDCQSGCYYIADISTNGVYVNDADEPLGRGNPRRLFSGDRLRMGEFEFLVRVDEGEELELDSGDLPRKANGSHDQFMAEEPLRTGIQLLDEEELTGDSEFQSALFGTTRMDSDRPGKKKSERPQALSPPAEQAAAQNDDLLDAFLEGAGVDRGEIHPSLDAADVMRTAGQVLREFVAGTNDLLGSRANLKSMFHLDQTTVLPRHNNPLKLAENSNDSIKQLLLGREGEYLGPLDSVREVCRDLRFHQDALLDSMIVAFREFADRFDPDELQENFDRSLNRKPLFGSFAKLKYWQLYRDLYPIVTQSGSGPFPQQVGEEFVRAYERHIAEYKRLERKDGEAA